MALLQSRPPRSPFPKVLCILNFTLLLTEDTVTTLYLLICRSQLFQNSFPFIKCKGDSIRSLLLRCSEQSPHGARVYEWRHKHLDWIETEVKERGTGVKRSLYARRRSLRQISVVSSILPSFIDSCIVRECPTCVRPIHPMHSQSGSRQRFIAVVARLSCFTSISDKNRMVIVKEPSRQNEGVGLAVKGWKTQRNIQRDKMNCTVRFEIVLRAPVIYQHCCHGAN